MSKLIILDRDGVINFDSDQYIKHPDEWKPIPGSLEAIALLNQHGYRVVVATNQSGIGRGLFDLATLNAMHEKMHKMVATVGGHIASVFFCPHTPDEQCECRKPRPGLFHQIADRFNVNLKNVPAVGDSLRDLQAASMSGCIPYLVLTGKGERTVAQVNEEQPLPTDTTVHDDLMAVAQFLIGPE